MSKILERRKLVSWLIACVSIVSAVGGLLALLVFMSTGVKDGLFSRDVCFTNSCIDTFISGFSSSGLILQLTWNVLGGLITFGGIVVALMSYLASVKSSALSNHISHVSIFSAYIAGEIDKRDRLNRASFDTLKWYNCIYGSANIGELNVASTYYGFVDELNRLVTKSNHLVGKVEAGGFRYKEHQERIKSHLIGIGITLQSLPRLDFFEVETQVFDLIDTINKSFCKSEAQFVIVGRKYL